MRCNLLSLEWKLICWLKMCVSKVIVEFSLQVLCVSCRIFKKLSSSHNSLTLPNVTLTLPLLVLLMSRYIFCFFAPQDVTYHYTGYFVTLSISAKMVKLVYKCIFYERAKWKKNKRKGNKNLLTVLNLFPKSID